MPALVFQSHQIGVDFLYLFGHKTELRDALGIELMLVAESNWLERVNRFAGLSHGFDVVFVACRGSERAEMAARINHNANSAAHCYSAYPSDIGVGLHRRFAETNNAGFSRASVITDVDIIVASGQEARLVTQGDVTVTRSIDGKRSEPNSGIEVTARVAIERVLAMGRVRVPA